MESDILAELPVKNGSCAGETEEEAKGDDVERIDYENDGEFYIKAQKYWSSVDPTGKSIVSLNSFAAIYNFLHCYS